MISTIYGQCSAISHNLSDTQEWKMVCKPISERFGKPNDILFRIALELWKIALGGRKIALELRCNISHLVHVTT